MNWNEMCKLEPKLLDLQREADQELSDRSSTRFWRKYESIKAQVKRMVGYHAKNQSLSTRECYDIAHDNVFKVMK